MSDLWPLFAASAAVVMWGFSFLSTKISVAVIGPMTLALLRFIVACAVLYPLLKWKEPKARLHKKDFPLMFLAGFSGISAYFYFENNGIKMISASCASLIIATVPVFSLAVNAALLKKGMNIREILSVVLSIAGVYLVMVDNPAHLAFPRPVTGYLMMFGAAVFWVFYTVITKPLMNKYSPLAMIYYQTLFGTLALVPFVFWEKTQWQMVSTTVILNVVYLGIFCSALAYLLYIYALREMGVYVSSLFINLVPVVTVIAGYLILGEHIRLYQTVGGALVIISVYLANRKPNQRTGQSCGETAGSI